jgi:hypothetical protein
MAERRERDPEFGPRGYLPERAAKRARKIILREPLSLAWVIGAILAGLALVIAGVLFLQRDDPLRAPPTEPQTASVVRTSPPMGLVGKYA